VLLEVGGSGNMTDWSSQFVNLLAADTTTCLYSRAGGRGSTTVKGGITRTQLVADADALLSFLHTDHGVDGPYVLVGWSLGGAVVLAEALAHSDTTAGMVILDSDFPADFLANCRGAGRSAADCQQDYDGDKEAKSLEMEIRRQVHPLPEMPIAVVSALQLSDCRLEPGKAQVEAEIGGAKLNAADCKALGIAIADKMRADWSQLGPQVVHSTFDVDHDGLTHRAAEQLAKIVLTIVDAKLG
jgi:pimeloyl-ACP methyl ester carboxylesterase